MQWQGAGPGRPQASTPPASDAATFSLLPSAPQARPRDHPHQLTLVAGLWPHLSRDDDRVLPIDRHLRVVALLESLAAGLHDLALGIGEKHSSPSSSAKGSSMSDKTARAQIF